jgi:hypothetical protein
MDESGKMPGHVLGKDEPGEPAEPTLIGPEF